MQGGRINLLGDLSVPFLALVLLSRSSPVSSGHDMASKKSGSKAALGPDASTTWLRKWATRAVIAFVIYVTYSVLDRIKVCAPFCCRLLYIYNYSQRVDALGLALRRSLTSKTSIE